MSGIAGIIQLPSTHASKTELTKRLALLIERQGNRGQMGFGVTFLSLKNQFHSSQSTQPAYALGAAEILQPRAGKAAIAHIHNSEHKMTSKQDAQPISSAFTSISLSGAIVNYDELKSELINEDVFFHGDSDAELFLRLVDYMCRKQSLTPSPIDYSKLFKEIDTRIDGAISVLLMDAEGFVIAYRNKNGLRPLNFMQASDGFMLFASENNAFAGFEGKQDEIQPSHIKIVDIKTGECLDCFVGNARHAAKLCAYETLYLGNPLTKADGQAYDDIRHAIGQALGRRMALRIKAEADKIVVASMPETGRPYADGLYTALVDTLGYEVERREVIELKSKQRTLGAGDKRDALIKEKYHLTGQALLGKTLIIADEALIYGDTSRAVTELLRKTGVESVHWAIGSAPIVAPNYYGVGIREMDNLAFWKVWQTLPTDSQQQVLQFDKMRPDILQALEASMANYIGSTSLTYLPYSSLINLLPDGAEHNDLSPFTLDMPTEAGQRLADANLKKLIEGIGLRHARIA